ncbi:TonB-dependent receptor [Avibacterium paragallinarum]|uniref:TonB-dependent receptor n=1 Tax=Avibacterium paragallinarum TaxID=728 RepID=UPI000F61DFE4|nr:Plug domain-containing protein [Avibacterium paragallinarum]AZI14575.1 Plug domain-containing protein/TonB-dependent transporter [Avibacterium paragallinarum]
MQHFDLRKFSISSIAVLISFYTNAEQNTLDYQQLDIIQVEAKAPVNAAPDHYLNTQQRINPTQLKNNHSTTLGSVVDKTSGVQSSAFGPNSSRPIVRGLSSQRVAILENNMPINDLAVISGNLATSINPLNAEDIEISKGGATILYGGRSIGGAINVLDEAIPKQILQNKISGQVNLNKGFNAADQGSFKLNVNDGSHWAGHIDASISKISSIKVPHNSKAAVCYDKSYLQSRTDLQRQCQVVIPVLNDVINPAYFKYISQYYLDNYQDKSLGLSEGDKYTNNRGFMGVNPPIHYMCQTALTIWKNSVS